MKFDVVTFGSAVIDTFVDTEFNRKLNSFNYDAGSKILIDNLKFDIGGGATNTAVAFARLGFKTGSICKIGDDKNGQDILAMLKKENVKFLGSKSKDKTGYSIILDSKDKDRTILTFKGPSNNIKITELPKFKTKWLYYSSLLGKSFETQKKLALKLKKEGTKIAFNPSDYLIKKLNILPLLKITDVLILNKEEAQMLCKRYNKKGDTIICVRELGPKTVVITDKNKLVYAYDGMKKYSIKPNKIKVVERTGAGDAFASGFVAGIMAGKGINESLKLGLREGESVIKYFGAKNNLLRMKLK
ncbi:MAG: carbohydrate kinase family protein [archaeon]